MLTVKICLLMIPTGYNSLGGIHIMSAPALKIDVAMKTALTQGFQAAFGVEPERFFSAPGRTEIGGVRLWVPEGSQGLVEQGCFSPSDWTPCCRPGSPVRLGLPESKAVFPLKLGLPESGLCPQPCLKLPEGRVSSPLHTGAF